MNPAYEPANLGTGREWYEAIPQFGNGKGMMKKNKFQERESEAFIPKNGRERQFPLAPDMITIQTFNLSAEAELKKTEEQKMRENTKRYTATNHY